MASSALAAWMTSKPAVGDVLFRSLWSLPRRAVRWIGAPPGRLKGGCRIRPKLPRDGDGVLLGCFLQQAVLADVLQFLGYHLETDQLCGTEGRRNSDIGRVTSPRNDDAPDPRMIVPRVKGEPATIKEHLVPCAKVHGGRISWNAYVAEVARAVAGRDVHATGQRHKNAGTDHAGPSALTSEHSNAVLAITFTSAWSR
jgi:hypothetical protein